MSALVNTGKRLFYNGLLKNNVDVINIDGRRVSFEAEVKDTLEVVGRGKHSRFIVDINKTFERLNAKHEKLFGK